MPPDWSKIKHFARDEFNSPDEMDPVLIVKLDAVREMCGFPLFVSSSFRSGDRRAHGRGNAVDISSRPRGGFIHGSERFAIIQAALATGFVRIGDYDRHIHLDVDKSLPQYVLWWDKSR
jgi:hypothetical protein